MGDLQEYERTPLNEVREKIIAQLKLNFAHDNINDVEFEHRVEAVHAATSKMELIQIVRDLPKFQDEQSSAADTSPVRINRGRVQETDTMVAILGGTERKGVWRPARKTTMFAFMGGMELDFTEAELPPGVTEISVFAMMGGCDIRVPPGLHVEVRGIPILGGIENNSRGVGDNPGEPVLRIKAVVFMGGVEINVYEDNKKKKRKPDKW